MEIEFEGYDRAIANYLWPPHWVGERPYWESIGPQPQPEPSLLSEVVTTAELPDGIRARVFRDGMIAFDMGDATPTFNEPGPSQSDAFVAWHESAVRLANAHLACLATVMPFPFLAPSGIATLWSVMQVDFASGKFQAATDYTSGGTRLALYNARQHDPQADFDWRFYRGKATISKERIESSFDLLGALLDRPSREMALLRAEMLSRAMNGLVHRDWGGALTNAWGAIEGLLGDLLSSYLDEQENRDVGRDDSGNRLGFINKPRRNYLEGSNMTSRHTVEFLSLLGVLPFEIYRASIGCAAARNAWLHKQNEPSPEIAEMAVKTLGELFELVEGVPLCLMPARNRSDSTSQNSS